MSAIRIFLRAFVVTAFVVSLACSQKVGTTSMQFLKVMPSARGAALGDAYSVWASGAEAVFWNPSGLALVQEKEISSTYIDWIFDTQLGALSYAMTLGDLGAVGVQLQYVDFGTMDETVTSSPYSKNWPGPFLTGRQFHPFSYLVGLSYARNLTNKFSAGMTIKYAHESLYDGERSLAMVRSGVYEEVDTWGDGVVFDFGIRYQTGFRTVQIAVAVQNFGSEVKYAVESNALPLLFRFGVAADVIGPNALMLQLEDSRLGIAFDLFQPNDYTQQEHLGVEYEFDNSIALRAGYKFNYDFEGLTAGVGVRQSISGVRLSLDYGFGSMGEYLGNVHRISLGAALP